MRTIFVPKKRIWVKIFFICTKFWCLQKLWNKSQIDSLLIELELGFQQEQQEECVVVQVFSFACGYIFRIKIKCLSGKWYIPMQNLFGIYSNWMMYFMTVYDYKKLDIKVKWKIILFVESHFILFSFKEKEFHLWPLEWNITLEQIN